MNDQKLEQKVRQDAARIKKDIDTLVGDSTARLSRYEENVGEVAGKAKEELTTRMEDGVSQLSKGFEKLTDDARETMVDTAATVKKEFGHRLSQYNHSKAKQVADKIPDGISKKVTSYPWVAISIGLLVGFLLGMLFKPTQQPLG